MVGAEYAPRPAPPYPEGYVQPPYMQVPGVPSSAYPPAIYPRQTATGITMSSNPGPVNWGQGMGGQANGLQAFLAQLMSQLRPQGQTHANPNYVGRPGRQGAMQTGAQMGGQQVPRISGGAVGQPPAPYTTPMVQQGGEFVPATPRPQVPRIPGTYGGQNLRDNLWRPGQIVQAQNAPSFPTNRLYPLVQAW